ncbi:Coatomer subunit delta [Neolecta irregularis DAH-3]|uniref:Coatomer subunit delta n=1 Tax=Neolecta irregularis (strain DAH-3) TaxID=1198029 RepID=A0A1U7LWM2_NEOID|nr:Coatomer subunit delta [Neolecta irregularis DAH-3]|eukprot:OLL27018.1 Coatomer subunit delta [Neolecta irregularis DAH-3]
MVVLAAAICTRGGKPVVSRHFKDLPRSRIEALLAAFPRLASPGAQHTTVETDMVRYVYQPLEELYMLLITNRHSNILQDIGTLHLFASLVTSLCRSCDERDILNNSFDLLSAFDEVVSLGYRESVSLAQVKTILEMDSHEEKIQDIISRNKELEAVEERKRRAKQLELQRKEMSKRGISSHSSASTSFYAPPIQKTSSSTFSYDSYSEKLPSSKPAIPSGKGMQLSKKSKTSGMLEAVRSEIDAATHEAATLLPSHTREPSDHRKSLEKPHREGVHLQINENVKGKVNRDGALEQVEIKGDIQLSVSESSLGKIALSINCNSPISQFQTHPNVDKKSFQSDWIIKLRDPNRSFPMNQSLGVVRWSQKSQNLKLPLSLNFWPSPSGQGVCDINIEYELADDSHELDDVVVSIPLRGSPEIGNIDGSYEINYNTNTLDWTLPLVTSSNPSGSLEFKAECDDVNQLYPVIVKFTSQRLQNPIDVSDVHLVDMSQPVNFEKESRSRIEITIN